MAKKQSTDQAVDTEPQTQNTNKHNPMHIHAEVISTVFSKAY